MRLSYLFRGGRVAVSEGEPLRAPACASVVVVVPAYLITPSVGLVVIRLKLTLFGWADGEDERNTVVRPTVVSW